MLKFMRQKFEILRHKYTASMKVYAHIKKPLKN
jgi:hypothetical protein